MFGRKPFVMPELGTPLEGTVRLNILTDYLQTIPLSRVIKANLATTHARITHRSEANSFEFFPESSNLFVGNLGVCICYSDNPDIKMTRDYLSITLKEYLGYAGSTMSTLIITLNPN